MDFIILLVFIYEVVFLYAIIRKAINQTEIVDLKSTKYFIPLVILNFAVYGIYFFSQTEELSFIVNFSSTVKYALDSCLMKFDFGKVSSLFDSNVYYKAIFVFSYILSALTLLYVALALIGRTTSNYIKCKKTCWSKKEKIVIIGYNEESKNFIKGLKNKKFIVWQPDAVKNERVGLLTKKELTVAFDTIGLEAFNKFSHSSTTFICFLNEKEQMLKVISFYTKAKKFNSNLYVAIDNRYDETFKYAYEAKNVMFFNKYSLVAQKFITEYPICSLLKSDSFDYSTATINDDVIINVYIMGYGYANKSVLYSMIIDNQFPTISGNKLCAKKINYHIFDKNDFDDKAFNYNTNRKSCLADNKKDYYDFCETPYNLTFHKKDLSSIEFQDELKSIFTAKNMEKTYNFVITSLGDDLENVDNTIRIRQFMLENGAKNCKFFVRLKNEFFKSMIEFNSDLVPFGEYEILNYETIVSENLNKLSIDRNFSGLVKRDDIADQYEEINAISSVSKQMNEINKLKLQLWNRLNIFDKEYNSYKSMNIRTKLNLLGLDVVGSSPISNKEYYSLYDTDNEIITKNRVKIYTHPYSTAFNPRNSLAFQEYLHNIAYFGIKGYLPFKKDEILLCDSECYKNVLSNERQAIWLTSYSDLDKIIEKRIEYNNHLLELDLKMPLYQVMDNLPLYKYSNYIIYTKRAKKNAKFN